MFCLLIVFYCVVVFVKKEKKEKEEDEKLEPDQKKVDRYASMQGAENRYTDIPNRYTDILGDGVKICCNGSFFFCYI